ncbi:MAG TPA: ATP-binding cassette domain-containing protein [Methanocorpusculum sp.]|nr:ATP-binding cassette domain-containing protein [Methanocorpusculum sp.]
MDRIQTENLCYSYEQARYNALDGISFVAHEHERIAVLGPNGAGKSTLFKHFNGILLPTAGSILIDGESITKKNLHAIRRKVGLVFQHADDQIFSSTVEQDIAFGPHNLGLSEEDVAQRVDSVVHMLALEDLRDRAPHRLSGGEKNRVAIAGILAMIPEVLFLYEPTAGLDPTGVGELFEFLNSLPETLGCTVIYSTHQVELVPETADRIYVMEHGRITGEGTPDEIFMQADLLRSARLELPPLLKLTAALREAGIDITTSTRYQDVEDSLLSAFGKTPRKHDDRHEPAHIHGGFGSHPHFHPHSEQ